MTCLGPSQVPQAGCEPPRVSRRLHLLRGWSHDKTKEVFTGGKRARSGGWLSTSRLSRNLSGQRSHRLRRRLTVRGKRYARGCVEQSVMLGNERGLTTDERQRLKELERENRELKGANEILLKASAFFAQAELDRRPR